MECDWLPRYVTGLDRTREGRAHADDSSAAIVVDTNEHGLAVYQVYSSHIALHAH